MRGTIDRPRGGSKGTGASGGGPGRALTDEELLALLDDICFGDGQCGARDSFMLNPRIDTTDGTDATPGDPADVVTLADVARFLPATTGLHAEPNGWAVVGIPANFWVDVDPVTVSASLLGESAQVRFTPRTYRFDYGDGTSRSTATPGRSWAALGQDELTETATGHVFASRGDREATLTVVYSAEYRIADGTWIAVSGAVSGMTPPQRVLVVIERTALTTPA